MKHKRVKTFAKPSWLTNKILEAIKSRDSLKKQLERGKIPRNTYNKARTKVVHMANKAKSVTIKKDLKENRQNSSLLLKALKKLNPTNNAKPVPDNLKPSRDQANKFNEHFVSIARPPPPTPTPEELVGMFFKWAEPTNRRNFAVLPYITGIKEPLTRILKLPDIQVTSRPVKTLQQHFPIPKFRPAEDVQCNVIYKIPCPSCPWSYIGETKRSFITRRKEHMRNLTHCTKGSNVAKHAWTFNHDIDFNNTKIIDKANNRSRKTLESWHTAKTVGADNNSCPLPRQYHILLKKH